MTRLGVLRGGASNEYDISLKTGAAILDALRTDERMVAAGIVPVDILIARDGTWFVGGRRTAPEQISVFVDAVWNALHGGEGEDGTIFEIIESAGIPIIGAPAFSGAQTLDKSRAKEIAHKLGVLTPMSLTIPDIRITDLDLDAYIDAIVGQTVRTMAPPWIVKPLSGGSSHGVLFAFTAPELERAIGKILHIPGDILIEEYIDGREIVAGGISGFRDQDFYQLIPVEVSRAGPILDKETRWNGGHSFAPLRRDEELDRALTDTVAALTEALQLSPYATFDFILSPRGLYFLEIDAQPALDEHSPFRAKLSLVGAKFSEFVKHVVDSVLLKK